MQKANKLFFDIYIDRAGLAQKFLPENKINRPNYTNKTNSKKKKNIFS